MSEYSLSQKVGSGSFFRNALYLLFPFKFVIYHS
jgi:hypothetical protein